MPDQRVLSYLTFAPGAVSGRHVLQLLASSAGFEAKWIRTNPRLIRNGRIAADKLVALLLKADLAEGVLELDDSSERVPLPCLHVSTSSWSQWVLREFALRDFERCWQGLQVLARLPSFGFGFAIPAPLKAPIDGIDLPGVLIRVAARMLIGPLAMRYLDSERVAALARHYLGPAANMDQLPLSFELYPFGAADAVVREREQEFAERAGLTELEASAGEIGSEVEDPVYEVEELGGGRLKLVTWLSENGKHIRRSRATRRRMVIQNREGQVVERLLERVEK